MPTVKEFILNPIDGSVSYEYDDGSTFTGSLDTVASGGTGPQGPAGVDGLSAYQIAVNEGFVGDESQWLSSLVGPQGPAGENGANGADGLDGTLITVSTTAPTDPVINQLWLDIN